MSSITCICRKMKDIDGTFSSKSITLRSTKINKARSDWLWFKCYRFDHSRLVATTWELTRTYLRECCPVDLSPKVRTNSHAIVSIALLTAFSFRCPGKEYECYSWYRLCDRLSTPIPRWPFLCHSLAHRRFCANFACRLYFYARNSLKLRSCRVFPHKLIFLIWYKSSILHADISSNLWLTSWGRDQWFSTHRTLQYFWIYLQLFQIDLYSLNSSEISGALNPIDTFWQKDPKAQRPVWWFTDALMILIWEPFLDVWCDWS